MEIENSYPENNRLQSYSEQNVVTSDDLKEMFGKTGLLWKSESKNCCGPGESGKCWVRMADCGCRVESKQWSFS